MTRSGPGRVLTGGLLALTFLCLAAGAPEEGVDFGLRPIAGLTFKVADHQVIQCSGKVVLGDDREEMELAQTITSRSVFTQALTEMQGGEIVALEREYEEVDQKIVARTSMAEKPQEIERSAPVAWKHYRARWKDGELTVEVKDEDTWKTPGDRAKSRLNPGRLRDPIVPLPRGRKKLGETWELDEGILQAYLADFGETGADKGRSQKGSARFTLTGFEDLDGDRCAVVQFELKLDVESGHESYAFTLAGKIHYSLRHRVPIRMVGEGPVVVKSEREQLGRPMEIRLKGKRTLKRTVEIVSTGGTEEKGR